MKKDIHPTYHSDAKITCACGNVMTIGSTVQEMHTELCSQCHPFYTGKQKLVDTAGRVDRFRAKMEKAKQAQTEAAAKKPKKKVKVIEDVTKETEKAKKAAKKTTKKTTKKAKTE